MKKIIRLTESDLVRIVNKVIKEGGYRTKFENHEYWIDNKGHYIEFDPDLENVGYYDFDYEPYIEIDSIEDMPEDIRNDLYRDELGERMYNSYKERFGKFKYARKKEN
jgi:hypothetical protein